ncbi:MAG TPA: hypothetical protein VFV98_10585, partial [Vicinamibacterales bacterium]|nr:hypothetical protein [Vicinamibacterales bacterium]
PAVSPREVEQVRGEVERLKADFDALRRQYDERLSQLEQRLNQLGGGPVTLAAAETVAQPVPDAPTAPAAPQAPADQTAAAMPASSSRVFNPDTSVIGNFIGAAGKNPYSTQPSLQLSEAEISMQAVVDPYARADFYLSAGPDGLEIEEGFATFTALPKQFQLKVGKMRAQFGKVNTLHTHAMPTIDRPLVTDNLVGGEEGISDGGVSVSKLIHNPVLFLEATGEVFAARSDVFQGTSLSKLNYIARLRGYHDLSEDKNIDLGVSFASGPTNLNEAYATVFDVTGSPLQNPALQDLNRTLVGIDATFRYRPLRRAIYQRLNLRTELIWNRQDLPDTLRTTGFGVYGLGEYQFARRWYIGGRLDQSARAIDGDLVDKGGSVFLTFWPTEFVQIRSQYRHISFAEGEKANQFLFQVNFAIGAHGAHVF